MGQFLLGQAVSSAVLRREVFAAPSFCDLALLERRCCRTCWKAHNVPYTAFANAENTVGQMADPRAGRHLRRI